MDKRRRRHERGKHHLGVHGRGVKEEPGAGDQSQDRDHDAEGSYDQRGQNRSLARRGRVFCRKDRLDAGLTGHAAQHPAENQHPGVAQPAAEGIPQVLRRAQVDQTGAERTEAAHMKQADGRRNAQADKHHRHMDDARDGQRVHPADIRVDHDDDRRQDHGPQPLVARHPGNGGQLGQFSGEERGDHACTGLQLDKGKNHIGEQERNGRDMAGPLPEDHFDHFADGVHIVFPVMRRHRETDDDHAEGRADVVQHRLQRSGLERPFAHPDGAHSAQPFGGHHHRTGDDPQVAAGDQIIRGRAARRLPGENRRQGDEDKVGGNDDQIDVHINRTPARGLQRGIDFKN